MQYIVEKDLAAHVRLADKVLPQTAYFTAAQQAAFDSGLVAFKQANLTSAGTHTHTTKTYTTKTQRHTYTIHHMNTKTHTHTPTHTAKTHTHTPQRHTLTYARTHTPIVSTSYEFVIER